MKPIKFTLLVTVVVVLSISLFSFSSWGNYYKKGRHVCDDLQEAKQLYTSNPKIVSYEIAYAGCLAINGDSATINEGMNRFHHILNTKEHAFAALFIAEFVESGGDFELPIDIDKINEAILAYGKVLAIINRDPQYPYGRPINYRVYEKYHQMELRAYYHIAMLYRDRFSTGFKGLHNYHLLTSPRYNGNRNLPTHPKYKLHTQESLYKVIESANRCSSLPQKSHFKLNRYQYSKRACEILKEEATLLQPLEEKRLVLLATESCRRDLPNCGEYNELHQQMDSIMEKSFSELKSLSATHQVSL